MTTFVCCLDNESQKSIRRDLENLGLCAEDVALAMNSRLCDLEDTIDINKYL